MKIKLEDLTNIQIDWLISQLCFSGLSLDVFLYQRKNFSWYYYTEDPSLIVSLQDEYKINVSYNKNKSIWEAFYDNWSASANTIPEVIAKCIVLLNYDSEVEIPSELIKG